MNSNKVSLSYEDLKSDIEVEIFGLRYGIKIDDKFSEKCEELEKMEDSIKDDEAIKKSIDTLLGEHAYDEISEKYRRDLGKDIDEFVWLKVVYTCVDAIHSYSNGDMLINNLNREQRRYNNRNRRYNNRNRRYRNYR